MPGSATADAREGAIRAAFDAIVRSAENLAGKAQRLAPVEEGTLRGSATVVLSVDGDRFESAQDGALDADHVAAAQKGAMAAALARAVAVAREGRWPTIEAEIAFNTVYAAYQHEELGLTHPLGGQAKYLEEPLNANGARYVRAITLATSLGVERAR